MIARASDIRQPSAASHPRAITNAQRPAARKQTRSAPLHECLQQPSTGITPPRRVPRYIAYFRTVGDGGPTMLKDFNPKEESASATISGLDERHKDRHYSSFLSGAAHEGPAQGADPMSPARNRSLTRRSAMTARSRQSSTRWYRRSCDGVLSTSLDVVIGLERAGRALAGKNAASP